jgi:hypothetical protein
MQMHNFAGRLGIAFHHCLVDRAVLIIEDIPAPLTAENPPAAILGMTGDTGGRVARPDGPLYQN